MTTQKQHGTLCLKNEAAAKRRERQTNSRQTPDMLDVVCRTVATVKSHHVQKTTVTVTMMMMMMQMHRSLSGWLVAPVLSGTTFCLSK